MSGKDQHELAAGLLRKVLMQLEAFPLQVLGRMYQLDDSSSDSVTATHDHPRNLPWSFIPTTQVKSLAQLLIHNCIYTDPSHSCSEQCDYALGSSSANLSWSEQWQSSPERSKYSELCYLLSPEDANVI